MQALARAELGVAVSPVLMRHWIAGLSREEQARLAWQHGLATHAIFRGPILCGGELA